MSFDWQMEYDKDARAIVMQEACVKMYKAFRREKSEGATATSRDATNTKVIENVVPPIPLQKQTSHEFHANGKALESTVEAPTSLVPIETPAMKNDKDDVVDEKSTIAIKSTDEDVDMEAGEIIANTTQDVAMEETATTDSNDVDMEADLDDTPASTTTGQEATSIPPPAEKSPEEIIRTQVMTTQAVTTDSHGSQADAVGAQTSVPQTTSAGSDHFPSVAAPVLNANVDGGPVASSGDISSPPAEVVATKGTEVHDANKIDQPGSTQVDEANISEVHAAKDAESMGGGTQESPVAKGTEASEVKSPEAENTQAPREETKQAGDTVAEITNAASLEDKVAEGNVTDHDEVEFIGNGFTITSPKSPLTDDTPAMFSKDISIVATPDKDKSRTAKPLVVELSDHESNVDSEEEMAIEDDNASDTENEGACVVCHKDENNDVSLYCDGDQCNKVYHTYCLGLFAVPDGNWYCPQCSQYDTANTLKRPAQMLEDLKKMDAWLVHSCHCNDQPCQDETHRLSCAPLKKALKCMSWLSFNDEARDTSFAKKLSMLIAFHATHCQAGASCPVPLCQRVRPIESLLQTT